MWAALQMIVTWIGTGDYDNDDFVIIMMMLMVMMILAGVALVSGWSRAVGSLTWQNPPSPTFPNPLVIFPLFGLVFL